MKINFNKPLRCGACGSDNDWIATLGHAYSKEEQDTDPRTYLKLECTGRCAAGYKMEFVVDLTPDFTIEEYDATTTT